MKPLINKRPNPYVGPRAFKYGEVLYGRERELPNLVDLLIAERIILLYSPSGAGKTSLLQAALIPELEKEDFQVLPVMRVSLEPLEAAKDRAIRNRYIFSLLLSLEEGISKEEQTPMVDLAQLSIEDYLNRRTMTENESKSEAMIFDQFEEILTANPTDISAKKEFFVQLGALLRNRDRWAIFAMREEYVTGLDPYLHLIPTRLSNTFRLELLDEKSARKAMQTPAALNGVTFTDKAALKMVDDLRKLWIQQPDGSMNPELGPYVEPVQLQVVCYKLWEKLPNNDFEIGIDDIENLGDVDSSLAAFYDENLKAIAGENKVKERFIREWFEHQLITEQGVRKDVLQGEEKSQGLDNKVIWSLVDAHIVRPERRRGFTWFELSHDRLIEPVRASNAAWFESNLSSFQRQALLWERQGRPSNILISSKKLEEAEQWATLHSHELTDSENDFLLTSQEASRLEKRVRQARFIRFVIIPLFILLVIATYKVHSYWVESRPWGYLEDISTGKVHVLESDYVFIGRPTEYFQNQIKLKPKTISRNHAVVFRGLKIMDVRSLNGSTINSTFIPYGKTQSLQDGDIVVLAGIAPLQLWNLKYSFFQFWAPTFKDSSPPSGWGIFIDGESRSIVYMDAKQYYLTLDEKNKYVLKENETEKTLLSIRIYDTGRITIEDKSDEMNLLATMKEGDYVYNTYTIPANREYDLFETEWVDRFGEKRKSSHDLFKVAYSYNDRPFQIVPIISDLEAGNPNGN